MKKYIWVLKKSCKNGPGKLFLKKGMNPALNYGKNMYRVEHITTAMGLLPVASLECLLQLWHVPLALPSQGL